MLGSDDGTTQDPGVATQFERDSQTLTDRHGLEPIENDSVGRKHGGIYHQTPAVA